MKLNPEELVVSSFDTTAEAADADGGIITKTWCSLEPTLCTHCINCGG